MSLPLISVIIPNFDNAAYVCDAVESVLHQTYSHIEVIVVDDGSTDDSISVLKKYDGKIKLVRSDNRGVSSARNKGIANSAGEYVAFLDSDDLWLPDKIERQIACIQADNELGLVHCGFVHFDDRGWESEPFLNGLSGWVAEDLILYKSTVILAIGSSILVRKSAIEAVGRFDEDLKIMEDWEFCYQVARKFKIGFVARPLVKYRIHGKNTFVQNAEAVRRLERDMLAVYGKLFKQYEDIRKYRSACLGRVHMILAGSFFRVGAYPQFFGHAVKSLLRSPAQVTRLLGFPIRLMRRQR